MAVINKVLLLDDDEANQLFFEMMLAQSGKTLTVYKASTSAHAEALVNSEGIHFVICAWEMSPMPGTVFLQKIKNNKQRKTIPFVIYSKRMNSEDIALTKDLGIENVLGMPFDKEQALEMIMNLIDAEEKITPAEKKVRRIEVLIEEGKYTEALRHCDSSVYRHPDEIRIQLNMAEIWIGIRNFGKAITYLDKALELDPHNSQAIRLKARWHSLQGEHKQAIELLEGMVDKCPKNIRTLLQLGKAYVAADEYDKAEEAFQKAEDVDPDVTELKDERGIAAFKRGDISLATQLLAETENALEIARSFNDMGIAKIAAKQFDEGILLYQNALKILSDKTKMHLVQYNLGLAFYKKGDQDSAFISFCDSYCTEPSYEKAYNAIAKMAQDLSKDGKSLDSNLVGKVKSAREQFKSVAQSH